ncbi:hypothetical protein FIBSPDRAFT_537428 [Athelia psychrophila]|uniref:Protein kinase domain-containing protein n=1 Tax=Athelia psychrophila TaxID=1759441 RepID=A0A166J7L5_9AGAM|nr:hypothetical protein FIBSPDRAFT_537428 [Fibularhizoctonia sp. CBS 109695]
MSPLWWCPCALMNYQPIRPGNPYASKLNLLSQVAGGFAYLHSQGVVHGNICGVSRVETTFGSKKKKRSKLGCFLLAWAWLGESFHRSMIMVEIRAKYAQIGEELKVVVLQVIRARLARSDWTVPLPLCWHPARFTYLMCPNRGPHVHQYGALGPDGSDCEVRLVPTLYTDRNQG